MTTAFQLSERLTLDRTKRGGLTILLLSLTTACTGVQSSLEPAGREAARIADLFWLMAIGAVVVWLGVIVLALWAVRARPEKQTLRRSRLIIVGCGAVFPTVVLTALLVYGLRPIPDLVGPAPEGSLKISVSGEQWWWRMTYQTATGQTFTLANELRLPVGETVALELNSPDVIHSFWIPSLAGKMDMIPGRTTRLVFRPNKTGIFRGVCAEYCGESHAFMAFPVVVQEKNEFDNWMAQQLAPAQQPSDELADRGAQLFLANGCGACHTARGTAASGLIGPDLTHFGSRLSLAAGTAQNDTQSLERWITHTNDLKPGVLMPEFHMLSMQDVHAISVYLKGLK